MDQMNRRALLKRGLGLLVTVPVSVAALRALAADPAKPAAGGAKLTLVDPKSQPAAAFGYVHDAKSVANRTPNVKTPVSGDKQFCNNCQFFSEPGGTNPGKCSMIANGAVTAEGWCKQWMKHPTVVIK